MRGMQSLDYEWARRRVAELVKALRALLKRGEVLPDDPPPPWVDTRPDVRPGSDA